MDETTQKKEYMLYDSIYIYGIYMIPYIFKILLNYIDIYIYIIIKNANSHSDIKKTSGCLEDCF